MNYTRIFITLSLVSLLSMAAEAKNIYVATSGDDAADGSMETPYLTVQKAATTAQAGDTVWLRTGTYRESVAPPGNGTEDQPIVFKAYPGEEVVISGGDLLTGWADKGDGIWEAPMQSSLPEYRNQLFINGKSMTKARWPNSKDDDPLTPEGALCDQPNCSMSQLSAIGGFPETWTWNGLAGASAWIMAQKKWRAWNPALTGYDPATRTVSFTEVTQSWYADNMNPGMVGPHAYGPGIFILSGARALLDTAGEWWFDKANNKVLIIPPEGLIPGTPGVEIEAKKRDYGFVLDNRSYIHVQDIRFSGTAISMNESKYCLLSGNYFYEFDYREGAASLNYQATGIIISGQGNMVRECEFTRCSDAGVTFLGRNNAMVNCYLHEVDYAGHDGGPVNLGGQGHLVSHNTVERTSRTGIKPRGVSHLVQYNHIREVGLVTRDLAAMKSGGFDAGNTVIRFNWVNVSNGNPESLASGIYMDNWHQNAIVHHNIVWNVPWLGGLICNRPGNYDVWVHNTIHGAISTSYGPWIGMETMHGTYMHNNWTTESVDEKNYCWSKLNNRLTGKAGMNLSFDSGIPVANGNPGGEDAGTFLPGMNDGFQGERPDIGALENGQLNWKAGHDFANPPHPVYEPAGFYYRNYVANGGFDFEQVNISPKFDKFYKWIKTGLKASTVEYYPGFNFPAADQRYSIHANSLHLKGSADDGVEQVITALPKGHFIFSAYVRLVDPENPQADVFLSVHRGEEKMAGTWAGKVNLAGGQKWRMVKVPFLNASEGDVTIRVDKQGNGEAYIDNIGLVPEYSDNPIDFTIDTSDIVIQVRHGLTKEALPDCRITFDEQQYVTDENGQVLLTGITTNYYNLLAEKEGFEDYSIEALEIFSDTVIVIDISIHYLNAGIKMVDRANGLPVSRARIYSGEDLKMTNSSGEVIVDNIAAGFWSFKIEHEDYFDLTDSLMIISDTSIVIPLTRKLARVDFYISDASGPVRYAAVTLDDYKVLTNGEGFTFFPARQARKDHHYLIHMDGYREVNDSFTLVLDTAIHILLEPVTGISGVPGTGSCIYPNPVQDKLYISINESEGSMQLRSLDGKLMLSGSLFRGTRAFDLSALPDGCYLLNLRSATSNRRQMILKAGD